MFAKIGQQAGLIAQLSGLLEDKGVFTDDELTELLKRYQASPLSVKAQENLKKFSDFAAIHKIARQYLDPPEE
jgi:hypothetical protein